MESFNHHNRYCTAVLTEEFRTKIRANLRATKLLNAALSRSKKKSAAGMGRTVLTLKCIAAKSEQTLVALFYGSHEW